MTAREIALHVVRDVFAVDGGQQHERGAQESLDYRLQKSDLQQRDRAFATQLAFGAIKMRRTLDWYLRPYTGSRQRGLPPVISEILRLSLYELRFTAAQPYATVSQWVGLAKRYGHRGTAGLVNAVLRAFLRDNPAQPQRGDFDDDDEFLGTAFSYPTWLVRQWREQFGEEQLQSILEACNAPAQVAVTINRAKTNLQAVIDWFEEQSAQAERSELSEDSILISDGALARRSERQADGAWWLQSESSAAVVDILNPQPGEMIVDACSGRGSKALQTAARLHGEGTLICIERDPRKARVLDQRAHDARLALATVVGDATAPILQQRFDRILIDAPCSSVGVVGRHPEARWRKRHDDGERLALTQRALLEALAPHVYEGGAIVYAVCSTDRRETSEVIDWFVRTHNVQRGLIPARFSAFETESGDVLIPPGLGGRDGFFIARLERGL
jgi:16S rRNA (cytosine967-C5)-methyltransferase